MHKELKSISVQEKAATDMSAFEENCMFRMADRTAAMAEEAAILFLK